jgi:hypothetical protein
VAILTPGQAELLRPSIPLVQVGDLVKSPSCEQDDIERLANEIRARNQ